MASQEGLLENRRLSFDFATHAATPRMSGKNLGSRQIPFVLSVARAKAKQERPDPKGTPLISLALRGQERLTLSPIDRILLAAKLTRDGHLSFCHQ